MKSTFDTIVIGSGVSGMTAAIYLKRANISVAIIENTAPGGQLNRVNKIDNYPGVLSIDGPSLAFTVFSQMQELEVPYIYGEVIKIEDQGTKKVVSTNKDIFECNSVIIATGRKPIETGLENEKTLLGKGISYCATCDGNLYKGKDVCVYTNNEEGFEEAKYLSKICNHVYVVGLYKENYSNITFIEGTISEIIEDEEKVSSIVVNNEKYDVSGVFVLLGSNPSTEFVDVEKSNDYILVNNKMETSKEGIFACGDVIFKELYQVSTAVGEGAVASNSVIKYLGKRD